MDYMENITKTKETHQRELTDHSLMQQTSPVNQRLHNSCRTGSHSPCSRPKMEKWSRAWSTLIFSRHMLVHSVFPTMQERADPFNFKNCHDNIALRKSRLPSAFLFKVWLSASLISPDALWSTLKDVSKIMNSIYHFKDEMDSE